MKEVEPKRRLYLAVPKRVMESLFRDDLGVLVLQQNLIRVMSFDPVEQVLLQWTD